MPASRSRLSRSLGVIAVVLRSSKFWIVGGLAAALLSVGWAVLEYQGSTARGEPGAAERTALVKKGEELLISAEKRAKAPPIVVSTASYGDGSIFDLHEERGNVVALYFMAAWCLTCIPEAQALAQLHKRYADQGLRILVLDVDQRETEEQLARFRERAGGGEHLWAMDRDYLVARPYGVRMLDSTIFIDRDGKIAYGDMSPTSYEDLAAVTEALLQ